jgi:hypothetical protein
VCLRFLNMAEFSHEPQEYRRYHAGRRDAHPLYRYVLAHRVLTPGLLFGF